MSGTVKIKSIKKINCAPTPVYDISVKNNENFILEDGSVVHNCKPYQYFKSTIYEKRLEMYNSKTLIDEIIDLERNINTGKVDHPQGGRKDVCDAVCASIYNASKHAEEFAYDYGEMLDSIMEVSGTDESTSDVSRQFEQELGKLYDPLRKGIISGQPVSQNNPSPQARSPYDFTGGQVKDAFLLANGIIGAI